jgi:hypothetical protein
MSTITINSTRIKRLYTGKNVQCYADGDEVIEMSIADTLSFKQDKHGLYSLNY